jgi:glycosidase
VDDHLHWWNDRVFYEVFVRSFQDSDGDGIGDLVGLTQRLDYLNDGDPTTTDDLGVTGLWLMPINDASSYHGYDATDYRTINPDYGTLADFQAFLAAAHARGIKVVMDFVMNHCSTQHPWFEAAGQNVPEYRDWFRWSTTDPGQTGPWGQDVWHWHPSGWYYGLFWGGMPDLNYETPAVKAEMFDTATYWLDTVGVDGFRLDAVLYIIEEGDQLENTAGTLQFWQDFGAHVRSVAPDAMTVGEAWTATDVVLQYVTDERLDFCFEFDLAGTTLNAVGGTDAGWLAERSEQIYHTYPRLQFGTFLTNHDQDRTMNVLGHDPGKARVAAGIYLTLPGIPFVYYGEEIGMTGSGAHENIRTPMQWDDGPHAGFTTGTPWHPVNGNYPSVNVADQQADDGSLLRWYQDLIAVRNGSPALRRGDHASLTSSASPVLAFVRTYEHQTVLCLANTAANAIGGITVSGSGASLTPGAHTLINLLDPADVRDVTVTPSFQIQGLSVAGHDVAVYQFVSATGAGDQGGAPSRAGLRIESVHPNPFNPATTIRYALPAGSHVQIAVYDVAGRQVAVLRDGDEPAGLHEVRWDGNDDQGRPASAGVYVARLRSGAAVRMAKLVLVK